MSDLTRPPQADGKLEGIPHRLEAAASRYQAARDALADARGDLLCEALQAYREIMVCDRARSKLVALCGSRGLKLTSAEDPATAIAACCVGHSRTTTAAFATFLRYAHLANIPRAEIEEIAHPLRGNWESQIDTICEQFSERFPIEYRTWFKHLDTLLNRYTPYSEVDYCD